MENSQFTATSNCWHISEMLFLILFLTSSFYTVSVHTHEYWYYLFNALTEVKISHEKIQHVNNYGEIETLLV